MNEWKRCSGELPDHSCDVLGYSPRWDGCQVIYHWLGRWYDACYKHPLDSPTHWMELPELPTEEAA
jgi:hypothetical protein